jgi:short-subunit dehydrogenase
MNLTNQQTQYTAIITGSTRGIGKETDITFIKKWNERYYIF